MADTAISPSKKVLLIEDDPVLGKMYLQKLNSSSFEVLLATDGEEAYDLVTKNDIDFILTDIMLPKMSGIEFVEKLKKNKKKSKIPIVAWSNLADDNDKQKVLELGVKEYLVKGSLSLEAIAEVVKKYTS